MTHQFAEMEIALPAEAGVEGAKPLRARLNCPERINETFAEAVPLSRSNRRPRSYELAPEWIQSGG